MKTSEAGIACAIRGLALCVMAQHAWAQQPPPSALKQPTPEPEEESIEQRGSPLLRIPVIGPDQREIYARGSSPNDAFARQNLVVGTSWQPTLRS